MKKLSIILIALLLMVGMVFTFAACDKNQKLEAGDSFIDEKDVEYEYEEDGVVIRYSEKKYEIKYLLENQSYITLSGAKINDLKLDGYEGDIKSISLKDLEDNIKINNKAITITGIENRAFYGAETLEKIDLSKDRMSLSFNIGDEAFAYCTNIESVVLPKEVYVNTNKIGRGAFRNNIKLQSVTIGEKFSYIGASAFEFCAELKSIALPSRVRTIEPSTFANCSSLNEVTYPAKLKSIGSNAFKNTAISNIDFAKMPELNYIGNYAFNNIDITSLNIPDGVTYIGNGAFADCDNLKYVDIPFLGNTIAADGGFNSIYGSENFVEAMEVRVRTTSKIAAGIFQNTSNVKKITIEKFAEEGEYRVYNSDGITFNIIEVKTHPGVQTSAFENCSSLIEVKMPRAQVIDDRAFADCNALEKIVFLGEDDTDDEYDEDDKNEGIEEYSQTEIINLQRIGASAFENCAILDTTNLLVEGVEIIGDKAFKGCKRIEELIIPQSVLSLGIQHLPIAYLSEA